MYAQCAFDSECTTVCETENSATDVVHYRLIEGSHDTTWYSYTDVENYLGYKAVNSEFQQNECKEQIADQNTEPDYTVWNDSSLVICGVRNMTE